MGLRLILFFSSCDGQTGIEEAYWSDHKMLYFFLHNLELQAVL